MFGIPLLKLSLWGNAALAAMLLAALFTMQVRVSAAHLATANANSTIAQMTAAAATQSAKFEADARRVESEASADVQRVMDTFFEGLDNVKGISEAAMAELRSGNRQLRQQWQTCAAAGAVVPENPAAPGTADGGADAVERAIERVLRIGAKYENIIRGLQGLILSYQKACGVPSA